MVSFEMIVGAKEQKENVSWHGKIDRNGRFYHVTQRAANRDFIFDKEIGQYRHNLLCRICSQFNVKIIFSVTMSNHTHDVLVANDIDDIAKVIRLVNTSVSHKLRKKYPAKYKNGRNVFEARPHYRVIKSIVDLTTVGKYVFDNAKSVLDKGEFVPYNCFWMFEKGLVTKPYDKKLYQLLFGMDEKQLYKLFSGNDANTVYKIANTLFRDWTTADNDRIFKKDVSKPWLDETTDPEK